MKLEKAVEDVHFGMVLTAIRNGDLVGRKEFNDGKLLYLVNGSKFTVNRPPLSKIMPMGTEINYQPHIDYMVDGNICGVYNLRNEDVLATDWFIVRYQSFLDKLGAENEGKTDSGDAGTDFPTSAF